MASFTASSAAPMTGSILTGLSQSTVTEIFMAQPSTVAQADVRADVAWFGRLHRNRPCDAASEAEISSRRGRLGSTPSLASSCTRDFGKLDVDAAGGGTWYRCHWQRSKCSLRLRLAHPYRADLVGSTRSQPDAYVTLTFQLVQKIGQVTCEGTHQMINNNQ